jgi:tetratricopeptide (TPR) repeat protein
VQILQNNDRGYNDADTRFKFYATVRAKSRDRCMEGQSQDADQRIIGCTTIINANGFGARSRLADALDGRCWAYHVKEQYDLAIADCKAAIAINPSYPYAYNNLSSAYLSWYGRLRKRPRRSQQSNSIEA